MKAGLVGLVALSGDLTADEWSKVTLFVNLPIALCLQVGHLVCPNLCDIGGHGTDGPGHPQGA